MVSYKHKILIKLYPINVMIFFLFLNLRHAVIKDKSCRVIFENEPFAAVGSGRILILYFENRRVLQRTGPQCVFSLPPFLNAYNVHATVINITFAPTFTSDRRILFWKPTTEICLHERVRYYYEIRTPRYKKK